MDFGDWLGDAPEPTSLEFWLRYWFAAYRHVAEHAGDTVKIVSYGRLTGEPGAALERLAGTVGIPSADLSRLAGRLRPPRSHDVRVSEVDPHVLDKARGLHRKLERDAVV